MAGAVGMVPQKATPTLRRTLSPPRDHPHPRPFLLLERECRAGFCPPPAGHGHKGKDFGIMKNTRLVERTELQFRADMFNVFNNGPPSQIGTFGLRVIQMPWRLNF